MSAGTMERTTHDVAHEPKRHPWIGPAIAGLGSLLVVAGALVHFYAVPKLAAAPVGVDTITRLSATGATVFDTKTLKPITTDLSVVNRTVGDQAASSKAPANTVVWTSMTTIRSVPDNVIRSQSTASNALNKKTAEAVDCCGNFLESAQGVRTPTTPSGVVYKFPFFTEKHSYRVWDGTLNGAVTATYLGTASINGMRVYKFSSNVPASVIGHRSLPASIFGLPGTGNVAATTYYQNATLQYVEPNTGAIINSVQDVKQWFAAEGKTVTTTAAHLAYTPATVDHFVNTLQSNATKLRLASGSLPWLVRLLGVVLMVGGATAGQRRH
ncbi:MAG: DUF3068 domain-containing protein [Marmoricola sp.]